MALVEADLLAADIIAPPPPPCTSLSCTDRLRVLEPPWVNLSSQPRINWKAGGVRGDCIVGEDEYIFNTFYCSPDVGETSPLAVLGDGRRPSLQRLRRADVHTEHLPQASFAELAALLRNRTLLIMGDSVMEQFYNALQCMMRRERQEAPLDDEFRAFIRANAPLWKMGKRKMPPKLPQRAWSGMRMLFGRAVTFQREDVAAAAATADVLVLNWGLHYHDMDQYERDLSDAFAQLTAPGARSYQLLFQETAVQHFKGSDRRGYTNGAWETRDQSTDAACTCAPIEDFNVNRQNGVLRKLLGDGRRWPRVRRLPFYELTRPRWRWHFGNCTHRPNGWNWDTCCDCTHFCYSPGFWAAHLHDLIETLRRAEAPADDHMLH